MPADGCVTPDGRFTDTPSRTQMGYQQGRAKCLGKRPMGLRDAPSGASILPRHCHKSVDRRAFLRGSGLAIGGLAAVSATGGTVTQGQSTSWRRRREELKKSSAHTAPSAVRLWPKFPTGSGSARSRAGTAHSTSVRTAPRVLPSVSTPTANAA
jgi:hypothetical protein